MCNAVSDSENASPSMATHHGEKESNTQRVGAIRLQVLEHVFANVQQIAHVVEEELDVRGGTIPKRRRRRTTLR